MNHRHKQQIRKRSVECLINKSLASLNHQHEMATGPQGTNSSVSRFVVSLWVIQLCLDGSDRCHASEVSTIEFIPVENLFIEQLEGDMPKFSANVCVCVPFFALIECIDTSSHAPHAPHALSKMQLTAVARNRDAD